MWKLLGGIALIAAMACGPKPSPAPSGGAQAPELAPVPAPVPVPVPVPVPGLTLDGTWTVAQTQPIVDKTQTVRLAPDLSHLTPGEHAAVAKLLEVGAIMQELYEEQRHLDAAAARTFVASLDGSPRAQHVKLLYRLFQGPIANTLDNQRVPFLGVRPIAPGKTVYPWGIEAAELDAFLAAHPAQRDALLAPRAVVRRSDRDALAADLATLDRHPVLDTLHPGLRGKLEALRGKPGLYAVPYSVAYADRLVRAHDLLAAAADAVDADDPELAGYLRNRGRDLLSDDYESGDAAWVTASFRNLNVQIGSYESYDDELHGAKTFFSLSVLARRPAESEAMRAALGNLQAFEDALPYKQHKRVRDRIPVGVYDVIADFGQARGGNTATILPNEAYLAQRYGRTILLRANIMRDPTLFDGVEDSWRAAIAPAHARDITADATFHRTLWHEIGHYLGVDRAGDGRTLSAALGDTADLLEEMKADLVSLFVAKSLRARGYYDDVRLRAVYGAGVRRVLQNNRPRRDQPYQTMQLVQWNFFLEKGVLRFDAATDLLAIDYRRYHDTVGDLLGRVLAIQHAGDRAAAARFVDQYTRWDDKLHGVIAKRIRDAQRYRYTVFRYAALGE
ncbi:MAG: NUDIX hydrolase [Myxococcota bacterium]|nr:NUDIX hydrolase [Myxococcota bacterium]